MTVKITSFNVTNHRKADNNSCNSYKSSPIVTKFHESAYLMMLINMEVVKYSQMSDITEQICMPTFEETDILRL